MINNSSLYATLFSNYPFQKEENPLKNKTRNNRNLYQFLTKNLRRSDFKQNKIEILPDQNIFHGTRKSKQISVNT